MSVRTGGDANYGNVDVGSTAKLIVASRSDRKSAWVQNIHASADLYVATSSTLSTSNCPRRTAGQSVTFDDYNGDIYGIAVSTGTNVRYIEIFD